MYRILLLCSMADIYTALSLAAQCIVIGPICVFATGGQTGGVGLLPR